MSYPVSDSMSCRRRARVPVPRRQTPAGAEDTSSRDSLVIVIRCAQRRPERQPRLHPASRSLVEVFEHAQRRPERQPRLHWHGCECVGCLRRRRSTKAGASTPATPVQDRSPPNEGEVGQAKRVHAEPSDDIGSQVGPVRLRRSVTPHVKRLSATLMDSPSKLMPWIIAGSSCSTPFGDIDGFTLPRSVRESC